PALRAAAPLRAERARDPHVHPAADGLMAWRTSHFVAAGALVAGGLAWASRDAWPWRRPLTAPAIVVDAAYADLTTALGRRETGWVETVETIPWAITRLRVTGAIESSLYDALDKAMADSFLPAPERRQLAWAIADVYDWEVDFSRDIRPGDRFTVLLERLESSEGERRFGRILAARVDVARTPQYAFYFEDPTGDDAVTGFYD